MRQAATLGLLVSFIALTETFDRIDVEIEDAGVAALAECERFVDVLALDADEDEATPEAES